MAAQNQKTVAERAEDVSYGREAPRQGTLPRHFLYTRLIKAYEDLCISIVLFLKVHNRIMNSHLTKYRGISELLRDYGWVSHT